MYTCVNVRVLYGCLRVHMCAWVREGVYVCIMLYAFCVDVCIRVYVRMRVYKRQCICVLYVPSWRQTPNLIINPSAWLFVYRIICSKRISPQN